MGGGTFMTLHRAQAAEPIGDGWHRARSTNGGFSVELPVPFNDLVIRGKTTDEVEMRSYTVGAKTPGLLAWSATCVARRDGKLGPEGRGAVSTGIEALGTPTKAYQRTVALEDRTCVLIVEAQGTDPLPPEVDRNRFFQSFRSTGAPAW